MQKENRKGIKVAKRHYKQHIEDHFNKNESCTIWKGIKAITNYKSGNSQMPNNDTAFPNVLNHFFACFDNGNNSPTTTFTAPLQTG